MYDPEITLIGLFMLGILLLVLRKIYCWYWKVDERLRLLREIRDILKEKKSVIN